MQTQQAVRVSKQQPCLHNDPAFEQDIALLLGDIAELRMKINNIKEKYGTFNRDILLQITKYLINEVFIYR